MQFDKTLRTTERPRTIQNLRLKKARTWEGQTMSVLAMTILDDQIGHVMFSGKNNGVLPF